jgi:hypothetical protein
MSVLIDSYSETNGSAWIILSTEYLSGVCQSFKPTKNYTLTSCKFYLNKGGSPTGNAVAKLYTHTGVFGFGSEPTGEALATSDNLDVSTISGVGLKELTFSGEYILAENIPYVIAIEYEGGDVDNEVLVGVDSTSPSHEGNYGLGDSGSYTGDDSFDALFYVYGDELGPTVGNKYPLPVFKRP